MTTAIWSLPALVTCPGACAQGCGFWQESKKMGHCYSMKAERLYKTYREMVERNLALTKRPDFREKLIDAIRIVTLYRDVPVDKIRVHESGDFYAQRYLDDWIAAAREFPQLTFYAYTKSVGLNFTERPTNFVVLLSDDRMIWKDHWHRFDGVAAIDNPIKGAVKCVEDCRICDACTEGGHFKQIKFRKH